VKWSIHVQITDGLVSCHHDEWRHGLHCTGKSPVGTPRKPCSYPEARGAARPRMVAHLETDST
jgi:hypothetical protein